MTHEEQRIALAEWDGWVEVYAPVDWMPGELTGIYTFPHPTDPEKTKYYISRKPVPDYLNDLNAVHLLEKRLTDKQKRSYAFILAQVLDTTPTVDLDDQFLNIHATAVQRCETLLKTLNLWTP
jgi:hypothetical protein